METTLEKRPPSGSWTGEQEWSRLRTLNEHLQQAKKWIGRRSREMITAYGLAAAQARRVGSLDEDVVPIATFLFLTREDHPDFVREYRNIVAQLDIPILPAARIEHDSHGVTARSEAPFQNCSGAWCALFLNLYERATRGLGETAEHRQTVCRRGAHPAAT
jgi:hypothetical protein